VVCHEGDTRLRFVARGDVLVRGDPAAFRQGLHAHGDRAAVSEGRDDLVRARSVRGVEGGANVLSRVFRDAPCLPSVLEDGLERRSRGDLLRREPVDLGIAAVGDDEASVAVEDAQTLRQVCERGIEALVQPAELSAALMEAPERSRERAKLVVADLVLGQVR